MQCLGAFVHLVLGAFIYLLLLAFVHAVLGVFIHLVLSEFIRSVGCISSFSAARIRSCSAGRQADRQTGTQTGTHAHRQGVFVRFFIHLFVTSGRIYPFMYSWVHCVNVPQTTSAGECGRCQGRWAQCGMHGRGVSASCRTCR